MADLPNGWVLDREDGITTRIFDGEKPGEIIQDHTQDIGSLLDLNTESRNYGTKRKTVDGFGPLMARVPNVIHMMLQSTGIGKDPRAMREWLDRPENAAFRADTRPISPAGMKRKYGTGMKKRYDKC